MDGLHLTAEQMNQIKNDNIVIIHWCGEIIHLCRCEPISNVDETEIEHIAPEQSAWNTVSAALAVAENKES